MIDVGIGYWMKDYDGYMLMKFTKKYRYQQCFLDGKLFFNTSDFFVRCDDSGRSDLNEGNTLVVNETEGATSSLRFEMVNGKAYLIEKNFSNNPLEYEQSNVYSYSPAENRNRKIISFYTMYMNLEEKSISPFTDDMSKEFGKYGILILDRQEFFRRVRDAIMRLSDVKKPQMGFVEYHHIKAGVNYWHPFKKEKEKFEYQNEFRITFVNNDNKPFLLDLGRTMRDIAVPIQAKDINEIHFEEEKLLYPIYKKCMLRRFLYKVSELLFL